MGDGGANAGFGSGRAMKPASLQLRDRFVVLVGLMGAGKTSVGRAVAERMGLPFIDADDEIEKAAGCTIQEIFQLYGEPAFRAGERRVIARIFEGAPAVLATGGGAFMAEETRALIARHGLSIWLRADIDVLYRRTRRRSVRPLLKNDDPRGTLERLARERYPIYALADITIDTAGEKLSETVDRVIARIETQALLENAPEET